MSSTDIALRHDQIRVSRLHFMNSSRTYPGIFSCSVDCFLELWVNIIGKVETIREGGNEFLNRMQNLIRSYEHVITQEAGGLTSFSLTAIRESVWSLLRKLCPSLRLMDCNAVLSEIFTRRVFGFLNDEQKHSIISTFDLTGQCQHCLRVTRHQIEGFVFFLSEHMFQRRTWRNWQDFVIESNRSTHIMCSSCNSQSAVNDFIPNLSDILFIEMSQVVFNQLDLQDTLLLGSTEYKVMGLVRNASRHFTCAIKSNDKWLYLDDLNDYVFEHMSLQSLLRAFPRGWFFLVLVKESIELLTVASPVSVCRTEQENWNLPEHLSDHSYFSNKVECHMNATDHDYCVNVKRNSPFAFKRKKPLRSTKKAKKFKANPPKQDNTDNLGTYKAIHETEAAIKEAKLFSGSINGMMIKQCTVCLEAWPVKQSKKSRKTSESVHYICKRCKSDKKFPKKFSRENDMVPGKVPLPLKDLTQCEEMLISRAFPVMLVYTRPGAGYYSYKGHVITLPHDVQNIADILPNLPKDLPIVRFHCGSSDEKSIDFKVRREKVLNALEWLVANNPQYMDITIDMSSIDDLPEDDFVAVDVYHISESNEKVDEGPCVNEPNDIKEQIETQSFLPFSQSQPHEKDRLEEAIQQCEMEINQDQPFNEFSTQFLATMCFSCLFPDGYGDPTYDGNRRSISDKPTESFAQKLKHLIKFAEFENGKWNYRFASHPRFAFWAYNMLYRKRLLMQGSYYISKNPDDVLSIDMLREMLENDASNLLMRKITYYAKNVTGTSSYWNQQRNNLKATISQVGPPTIFWTLSCAEFHWPEFHKLLSDTNILSLKSEDIRNNVVNNHHLLDWFFTERTELFVKLWLYRTLGAKWHWFRYEFTVNRGSIHCHGLAKLSSDPGLCELSKQALEGFLAKQKIDDCNSPVDIRELNTKIEKGLLAEKAICDYHDYLMSTCNPIDPNDWVKPDVHPCKKGLIESEMNLDDYSDLVNSVQRHTKCNSSYCLRKDSRGEQYCRFKFPFDLTDLTFIEYQKLNVNKSETTYRPVIVSKRDDSRVNRHQRLQLQTWRGNCDIQLVIDYRACLEYLAKYASKPEKMSCVLKNAFTSVVQSSHEDSNPKSIIKKLMMKGVGERDMSIQEVMHSILSLKFVSSSFNVVTVSLANDQKLDFKDGDICTKKSCLDKYANRCQIEPTLTKLNLVDFFSNYISTDTNINKRSHPVIVRTFPTFSCNPQNENYGSFCKYQLLKYKPWQGNYSSVWDYGEENDLTFITCWQAFLNSEMGKQVVSDWERELSNAEKYFNEQEQHNQQSESNTELQREEWMYLSELIGNKSTINNLSVEIQIAINDFRKLYTPQQISSMPFWLESVKSEASASNPVLLRNVSEATLNSEQLLAFNIVKCHFLNEFTKPLHMIITGQGGSGKSYLIDCLKNLLGRTLIVSAYFGLAAYNVGGLTLHSLLQLPIMGRHNTDLKGKSLQKLQLKMEGINYLIIDEYSVIGQKMLGWIDRRCRQSTGQMDKPFGGLSVILVGDINQLPPVNDHVLYHSRPITDITFQGLYAYKQFNLVVKLNENLRASGVNETRFRSLLINLREGQSTIEDWELLKTRNLTNYSLQYREQFNTKLAYSNKKVAEFNHAKVQSLREPVFEIRAKHNHSKANSLSTNEFGGLEPILFLCKGAKVMLTRNLWTDKGLCNGSVGYVRHIIYKEGDTPPVLPIAVLVQFENYTGPSFIDSIERCIPIVPVISELDTPNSKLERMQIPLKLCWAITIHKSQGLTLRNVCIDIGSTEKVLGLTYVALSRAKALDSIILEPFSYDRLLAISKCKNFNYRVKEENRLTQLANNTAKSFKAGVTIDILMQIL